MAENTELITQQDIPQEGLQLAAATNLLQNSKLLNQIIKLSNIYASSSMVPDSYRGKQDNCFVAIELASRMDVSPVLVMQNLYIVQGKPSWAGQACKALIDGSGKFKDSEYVMVGNPADDSWGCYLQAVNTRTGKTVKGTTVTLKLAKDEGWLNKNGSKWKTMPEQMMKYRAAAFFARTECPEVLMGFQTADEVEDVRGAETPAAEKITISLEGNNA